MITAPPRKVLDIGIGAGHAINYLSQRFPEADLYGIDVSEQAVRHVASRFRGNFAVGKIENLPWGDIQFDAILMLEVLEHIQVTRTFRILRAVRARLADKGALILSVPLESVEDLRRSYSVCPHCGCQVHPIGHVRSYSELEPIRTELNLSGLEIESMLGLAGGTYFGIPRQWLMHFFPARVKPMVMIFRCRRRRA
jgi:cyclopropane fatty-acyl-phospholipid synthase-like methyltransferase